jgi:hypothetical protein
MLDSLVICCVIVVNASISANVLALYAPSACARASAGNASAGNSLLTLRSRELARPLTMLQIQIILLDVMHKALFLERAVPELHDEWVLHVGFPEREVGADEVGCEWVWVGRGGAGFQRGVLRLLRSGALHDTSGHSTLLEHIASSLSLWRTHGGNPLLNDTCA